MKTKCLLLILVMMNVMSIVHAQTVYLAGMKYGYSNDPVDITANVWKDGMKLYSLTHGEEEKNGGADAIYVSDGDVYIAGNGGMQAMVWKNGTEMYRLTDIGSQSHPIAIQVVDNDVYVAGIIYNSSGCSDAVVWKNGTLLYTLVVGQYNPTNKNYSHAIASAVQVVEGNVYIAGYVDDFTGIYIGKVWKNGREIYKLNESDESMFIHSISVQGNDIYVAGYTQFGPRETRVWKNGEVLYTIAEGSRSMFVSGEDVYLACYSNNILSVWKNNSLLYNLTDGSVGTMPVSVYVYDNDVYYAGLIYNSPTMSKVWKNEEVLYEFSDDMDSYFINTIFITPSDVKADEVKTNKLLISVDSSAKRVKISGVQPREILSFYNTNGQLLFTHTAQDEVEYIPTGYLPAGVYIVKTSEGETVKWINR